jgi:hypothetical protein
MARKIDDDGIELSLKKILLITPNKFPSSGSMDEEDGFPPL